MSKNNNKTINSSLDCIRAEFEKHDIYKANYKYLLHMPMVQDLIRENKSLKEQTKTNIK